MSLLYMLVISVQVILDVNLLELYPILHHMDINRVPRPYGQQLHIVLIDIETIELYP